MSKNGKGSAPAMIERRAGALGLTRTTGRGRVPWKQLACVAALGLSLPALAAVSAEEAKQLGTTLTEFGAIKAGNADGTIPPYTGGLRKAPADFKPDSGFWTDPFKDEAPLYRIDAKNMDKYAAKLSDGQKYLLKKYPDTYFINVYPSHRTAAYPDNILKNTLRNATTCKLEKDGLAVNSSCAGGMPFPIPKNGNEAMWNMVLRYQGSNVVSTPSSRSWVVDSSGRQVMTAQQTTWSEMPYYQTELEDRNPEMLLRAYSLTTSPARNAGVMTGIVDFIDPVEKPKGAWSYTPGMRRVKLSPEFSYDTPVASMGGVVLFDELFMFSGKQDRFDFKLVGKKEMYIPYNSYKSSFSCAPEVAMQTKHAAPSCERWELHRVWQIEATLKPGMRHVYSKRTYYVDEDMTSAGLYDAWDQNGALYRAGFVGYFQMYDKVHPWTQRTVLYDFNKSNYAYINDTYVGGYKELPPRRERELTGEAIVGRETVR